MKKESRDTRKVLARLLNEGWIQRHGKGDHVNLFHPTARLIITIDTGKKEIDKSIFNRIKKIAGWK